MLENICQCIDMIITIMWIRDLQLLRNIYDIYLITFMFMFYVLKKYSSLKEFGYFETIKNEISENNLREYNKTLNEIEKIPNFESKFEYQYLLSKTLFYFLKNDYKNVE